MCSPAGIVNCVCFLSSKNIKMPVYTRNSFINHHSLIRFTLPLLIFCGLNNTTNDNKEIKSLSQHTSPSQPSGATYLACLHVTFILFCKPCVLPRQQMLSQYGRPERINTAPGTRWICVLQGCRQHAPPPSLSPTPTHTVIKVGVTIPSESTIQMLH